MKRFLLIFVLCLAFVALVGTACIVTSAENGYVGDNLLLYSDFVNFGSSDIFSVWSYNQSYQKLENQPVVLNYSGSTGYFIYRVTSSNYLGNTYTFTYRSAAEVKSFTFSVPSSLTTGASFYVSSYSNGIRFRVYVYANSDLGFTLDLSSQNTMYYCKLEQGSSFTGFVANDFSFAGYNDGISYVERFNDGFVKAVSYYDFASSVYDNTQVVDGRLDTSPFWNVNGLGIIFSTGSGGVGLRCTGSNSVGGSLSDSFNFSTPQTYTVAFYCTNVSGLGVTSYSYTYDGVLHSFNCKNGLNIVTFSITSSYTGFTFSIPRNCTFDLRNYKLENGDVFTGFPLSSFGADYSSGYQSGYSDGKSVGDSEGYDRGLAAGDQVGYDRGFNAGKLEGDNEGYLRGLSTAQSGTWPSLISALINVPVTAIISLLNFDILGFNMLNVFRTIILLSLFFFVLNLCLGKVKVS